MGEQKHQRDAAVLPGVEMGAADPPATNGDARSVAGTDPMVVRLSDRQHNRIASAFGAVRQAHEAAMQTLTDVLIGKDIDLDQFSAWEPTPDLRAAILTPKGEQQTGGSQ